MKVRKIVIVLLFITVLLSYHDVKADTTVKVKDYENEKEEMTEYDVIKTQIHFGYYSDDIYDSYSDKELEEKLEPYRCAMIALPFEITVSQNYNLCLGYYDGMPYQTKDQYRFKIIPNSTGTPNITQEDFNGISNYPMDNTKTSMYLRAGKYYLILYGYNPLSFEADLITINLAAKDMPAMTNEQYYRATGNEGEACKLDGTVYRTGQGITDSNPIFIEEKKNLHLSIKRTKSYSDEYEEAEKLTVYEYFGTEKIYVQKSLHLEKSKREFDITLEPGVYYIEIEPIKSKEMEYSIKEYSGNVKSVIQGKNAKCKVNSKVYLFSNIMDSVGLSWKSSNNNIATVNSSGIVTGKKSGNCIISVTNKTTGMTASCKLKVEMSGLRAKLDYYKSETGKVYFGITNLGDKSMKILKNNARLNFYFLGKGFHAKLQMPKDKVIKSNKDDDICFISKNSIIDTGDTSWFYFDVKYNGKRYRATIDTAKETVKFKKVK